MLFKICYTAYSCNDFVVVTENAEFGSESGGTPPSSSGQISEYLLHLLLCSQTFTVPTASTQPHSLFLPRSPTSSLSLMPLLFLQTPRLSLPTNHLAPLCLQPSPRSSRQEHLTRSQANPSLFSSTLLQFQLQSWILPAFLVISLSLRLSFFQCRLGLIRVFLVLFFYWDKVYIPCFTLPRGWMLTWVTLPSYSLIAKWWNYELSISL